MAVGKDFSLITGAPALAPNYEEAKTVSVVNTITTNAVTTCKRSIQFEYAQYDVSVVFSGANTQGVMAITLPTGDVIDFDAITPASGFESLDPIESGVNVFDATGTSRYLGRVFINTNGQVRVNITEVAVTAFGTNYFPSSNTLDTSVNKPITFATGDQVTIRFKVPLVRLKGGFQVVGAGVSPTLPSLVPGGYEKYTHTSTFQGSGGGTVSSAIDIKFVREGDEVTMTLPAKADATPGGSSTKLNINSAIPARFRPPAAINHSVIIYNNNVAQTTGFGYAQVTAAGGIDIYRDLTSTAFTNALGAGFAGFSMSWCLT